MELRPPTSPIVYVTRIDDKTIRFTIDGQEPGLPTLRAVVKPGTYYVAILDNGLRIHLSQRAAEGLRASLGLQPLRKLDPHQRTLYDEGLRDWPLPLADATAEQLKAWFQDDERRLMANVIWQVVHLRRQGVPVRAGTYHRELWYWPLLPALVRAGFAREIRVDRIVTLGRSGFEDPQYRRMVILLGTLVGSGLFDYEDLGFDDPHPASPSRMPTVP